MQKFFARFALRVGIPAILCFVGVCLFVTFTADFSRNLPTTAPSMHGRADAQVAPRLSPRHAPMLYGAAAFMVCLFGYAIVLCYRQDKKEEQHRRWLLSEEGIQHQIDEVAEKKKQLEHQLSVAAGSGTEPTLATNEANAHCASAL